MFDNLFFTVLAGFFLDVFNNSFLGSSIILLAIIYFVVAKLLSNLKSSSEEYPLAYFIPIFTISLIIYQIFLVLLLYFQSKMQVFSFSWFFIIDLIYNLIFSLIGYYIFKKIFGKNDRQLSLNI